MRLGRCSEALSVPASVGGFGDGFQQPAVATADELPGAGDPKFLAEARW